MTHYLIRWVSSGQELWAIFANWLQIDTQAHISNWRLKLELDSDSSKQAWSNAREMLDWVILKFQIGIQACFTTFTYSSRFSSPNYRWKECHTGIILLKKDNYCSFAYSPLSTSLIRAWARQNKKWLARTVKIWINMFSPGTYPREQSEDWSNCVDAQANQSWLGAQLFCWFYRAVAQTKRFWRHFSP